MSLLRYLVPAIGVLLMAGTAAQAVPIRDLPNLTGVVVFERTGVETPINLLPNGSVITTRLDDRLSFANSDFQNTSEFYDFFYSDADGTFNPDGAFLSITAVFDNPADGGLNISRVALVLPSGNEFASFVSSFVSNGAFGFPNSVDNALGDTPNTTTFLGDTAGQPDSFRLRLTVGFESTREAATQVSEPGTLALFGLGLGGLILARRRRAGRVQVRRVFCQ